MSVFTFVGSRVMGRVVFLLCLLSSVPQVLCPKKGEHLFHLGWKHSASPSLREETICIFPPHPKPDLEEEAGGCDKVAWPHNLLIPFFVVLICFLLLLSFDPPSQETSGLGHGFFLLLLFKCLFPTAFWLRLNVVSAAFTTMKGRCSKFS